MFKQLDNLGKSEIKSELSLEDAVGRLEHQFEMSNGRLDMILIHLEKINAKLDTISTMAYWQKRSERF